MNHYKRYGLISDFDIAKLVPYKQRLTEIKNENTYINYIEKNKQLQINTQLIDIDIVINKNRCIWCLYETCKCINRKQIMPGTFDKDNIIY